MKNLPRRGRLKETLSLIINLMMIWTRSLCWLIRFFLFNLLPFPPQKWPDHENDLDTTDLFKLLIFLKILLYFHLPFFQMVNVWESPFPIFSPFLFFFKGAFFLSGCFCIDANGMMELKRNKIIELALIFVWVSFQRTVA